MRRFRMEQAIAYRAKAHGLTRGPIERTAKELNPCYKLPAKKVKGNVAKTDGSVRRGWVNSLYAANPNSWSMMRFCARTSLLLIPSSWPL
jgi:hypothetical protein